jgi:hypothetical protein
VNVFGEGIFGSITRCHPHVFVKRAQSDENTRDAVFFCESVCARGAQAVVKARVASALERSAGSERAAGRTGWRAEIISGVSLTDFGTSVLLLAPLLGLSRGVDRIWENAPKFTVIVIGECAFVVGWSLRWLIRQTNPGD